MSEATAESSAAPESNLEKPKGTGGRVLDWWRSHCDPATADPGTRARLRRCDSPIDAATIPAAVTLARRLGAFADGVDDRRVATALNLARVLAQVREHAPGAPMRAAGWKSFAGDRKESEAGEDRPLLSEARFRRLLTTGPGEEQVVAFVRLVAILDGAVDVAALGADFLDWEHPWRGERVRKRWAEDYFAARTAGATSDPSPTTDSIPAEADA
ncbi:MAG TPA: type I-E CRISPR-associated protein Cse2/CasB [Gemmatimonadaceae bacterium]|nr:type I-E CRISPR-associated protein Cse2/CasB [Gemmatimonadaceae bacterium]